jgi:hypothetical protein
MEEVVGSIPTRSTIFSTATLGDISLRTPLFTFVSKRFEET